MAALARAPGTLKAIDALLAEAGRGTEPAFSGLEFLGKVEELSRRGRKGERKAEAVLNYLAALARKFPDRVPREGELDTHLGVRAPVVLAMWAVVKYVGVTKDAQDAGWSSDDPRLDESWRAFAVAVAPTKPGPSAMALLGQLTPGLLERTASRFRLDRDELASAVIVRMGGRRGPVKLTKRSSTPTTVEQAIAYLSAALTTKALDVASGLAPEVVEALPRGARRENRESDSGDESDGDEERAGGDEGALIERVAPNVERRWKARFLRMRRSAKASDPQLLDLLRRYFEIETGGDRRLLAREISSQFKARRLHQPRSPAGRVTLQQVANHLRQSSAPNAPASIVKRRIERAFARARAANEIRSPTRDPSGAWLLTEQDVLAVLKRLRRKTNR